MLSELRVTIEDILLRDHRIVIPKSLRKRIIELVHGGHHGIVKTKRLIRSRVWLKWLVVLTKWRSRPMFTSLWSRPRCRKDLGRLGRPPTWFGPTQGCFYWFGSISATTPTGRPYKRCTGNQQGAGRARPGPPIRDIRSTRGVQDRQRVTLSVPPL